jgi:hypothetical protein
VLKKNVAVDENTTLGYVNFLYMTYLFSRDWPRLLKRTSEVRGNITALTSLCCCLNLTNKRTKLNDEKRNFEFET